MKRCLLLVLCLILIGFGASNASDVLFVGFSEFPVSVTNMESGADTFYFRKYNQTLTGYWFVDPNKELNPSDLGSSFVSPSPCLAGFLSLDGANEIWIYDGTFLATDTPSSKNEKFLFIGTGTFLDLNAQVSAAAYIDASGTYKQDSLGNVLSAKMKGRVGAGMRADDYWPYGFFILNGQFTVTLTPE